MRSIRAPRMVLTLVAGAAVWLGSAAAAPAQIHVVPGSPAGQQYSVPLQQAREEGAGNRDFNADPGSGGPAPRFGEGITPGSKSDGEGTDASSERNTAAVSLPGSGDTGGSGGALPIIVGSAALLCLLAGIGGRRIARRQPG